MEKRTERQDSFRTSSYQFSDNVYKGLFASKAIVQTEINAQSSHLRALL
jgi:hypothetical protein